MKINLIRKKYIGQSTNIERRRKEHINNPSKYSKFDQELKSLGEEQFYFFILEECLPEELDEKEKYWIKFYNSIKTGYNLVAGGQNYRGISNPGAKLTEEDVLKIISLLEEHKLTNTEISKLFGVHRNTIDQINRCLNWTHLHNYKKNIRQENLSKLEKPHSSFAGENNPLSKITEEKALKIIHLLEINQLSLAEIARQEEVAANIVYDINRCRTWKYLHNYKKNIRNEYSKAGDDVNED